MIAIMFWYKSSIQERSSPLGAKMGRGSPVCQQIREKIIEMFQNNVSQKKDRKRFGYFTFNSA